MILFPSRIKKTKNLDNNNVNINTTKIIIVHLIQAYSIV